MSLFKVVTLCLVFIPPSIVSAQSSGGYLNLDSVTREQASNLSPYSYRLEAPEYLGYADTTESGGEQVERDYPNPKSVLYKSLIIPGWGQIVNKQAWKVPLVYGLIGGVAWYSVYLTKQYHDYRAAFYNATHDDMKFGPTPAYIPAGVSTEALRNTRNRLRNRRDFTYIGIVLAYGLNALDAYVFAHMRSFDVSEDLSVKADLKPTLLAKTTPGITLSFKLFNHTKRK